MKLIISLVLLLSNLFFNSALAHVHRCKSGLKDMSMSDNGYIKVFLAEVPGPVTDRPLYLRACRLAMHMCTQYNLHFYNSQGQCFLLGQKDNNDG